MTAYMLEQQLKQQFKHKFTVHQYHQIAETGIFSPSDRVELLIDGEIIKMSPVGRKHAACVARLNDTFSILAFPDLNCVWTDMFANSFDRPNV
ncbi:Uma2 family endonuclease [Tumidithrix elongata RA019]|uniref:Uma2 family endonuclease n=1 Tax=Tumidithrix elongata BACA0141 TaxID=2716417 RepID=A0AAW9PV53_9CYAN|nr:Uma2 family endonuclease [Tumidithrix elongata RA019]